ncbi:MAG: type II secretion system protein [Campylobacterales bacterium]|nr:type II secretion system protein [Campylobacterales bacterium]
MKQVPYLHFHVYHKTKSAFTMLELIFVIIVLGILASMVLTRIERDIRQEAADSILSDIRYTQHLALIDDKHQFDNPKWQQRFWRIVFSSCSDGTGRYYMIGTDDDMDSSTNAFFEYDEAAVDPSNGKRMFWENTKPCASDNDTNTSVSDRIFITKNYGIQTVTNTGGCGAGHIGFDHLGRPHAGFSNSAQPNSASYMTQRCTFTFTMSDGDTFSINVEPETGYAYISNQPES